MKSESDIPQHQRGSVLIAAIIFAMVAFTLLGSLLPTYMTDYRMSVRNRHVSTAFSLAEAGGEEAIWAIYEYGWDTTAWDSDNDWKKIIGPDGNYYTRRVTFPNVSLGGPYTGYAKVAVKEPVLGDPMEVVAQGIVVDGAGNEYVDQIVEVDTSMFNPAQGFIAKDVLDLGSGTIAGSTNTDNYNTIAAALALIDNLIVLGSLNFDADAINIDGTNKKIKLGMIPANVFKVLTGGDSASEIRSNYFGTITEVETNFSASFPKIDHPQATGNNGPGAF
ncbi:MAG: pilus assembly PilX family protein [Puniceicoccales bacterium]